MKAVFITTVALAVAALAGCVRDYTPPSYKNSHSRAYNIASAGGLHSGIRDVTAPREVQRKLSNSLAVGAADTYSGYNYPNFSLTLWNGGLVDLATWAVDPKTHGARRSLIAWMPAQEAASVEEAQAKFLSHVKVSAETALSSLGADPELLYDEDGLLIYHFSKSDWNCPAWVKGQTKWDDICRLSINILEPRHGTAPEFISGAQGSVYAFTSGHVAYYNYVEIENGTTSHFPQQAIYAALSERLPAWTYLYLAPRTVTVENGEKIGFPYLLEKGKPEFFVYPQT